MFYEFTKEQIYIVTGASSGIGRSIALLLNANGASVIAIGRDESSLCKMKSNCKFPENTYIEIKDLAENVGELPIYVSELKKKYGKFSGLAYCAGISCVQPLQALDYETLKKVIDINFCAPLMFTKGIIDRRNNIGKGCSLVYISSIDAKTSTKGQCAYSGSKAALSASIKTVSKEASSIGIRMNCILPSMIKTKMTYDLKDILRPEEGDEHYPFGWGEAEDVANLVLFLLSDKSKFISGQNYIIDSGGVI